MSIARTIQIEKALTDCVTDVSKLMSIAGKHGDYLREIFSLIPSYATKTELMAAVTSMNCASIIAFSASTAAFSSSSA